jgi:hypothetical protein
MTLDSSSAVGAGTEAKHRERSSVLCICSSAGHQREGRERTDSQKIQCQQTQKFAIASHSKRDKLIVSHSIIARRDDEVVLPSAMESFPHLSYMKPESLIFVFARVQ